MARFFSSIRLEQYREARARRKKILNIKRYGTPTSAPRLRNPRSQQRKALANKIHGPSTLGYVFQDQCTVSERTYRELYLPQLTLDDLASGEQALRRGKRLKYIQKKSSSFDEPSNYGEPNRTCEHCHAVVWYEERTVKSKKATAPKFSICCGQGKVELPLLKQPPQELQELLDYNASGSATKFRESIRAYNSMFAFTSIGGRIDTMINDGKGPYVFRLGGQNHHRIGSLLPPIGMPPKFSQLYMYDSHDQVTNRMAAFTTDDGHSNLDSEIVGKLVRVFDINNEIVKMFRPVRERFAEDAYIPVRLRLIGSRTTDGRVCNMPVASEVAALVPGDDVHYPRDVIIDHRAEGLKRLSTLHPSFMPMQYPILFPHGEDGYRKGILHRAVSDAEATKRNRLTMREYYAYRLQHRRDEGHTLLQGGKLFQQFVVDAYTCIEHGRLCWIRLNQKKLRADLYNNIRDAVVRGDTCPTTVGKRVVLPASFTGGPRFMQQNYQDALAICRRYGHPDFFITFTCNAKWPEIQNFLNLIPGQKPEDRPDIVARVFQMKLDELMADLRQGRVFGKVLSAVYTIEFQKRGLPHAHILVWLSQSDKLPTPTDVDRFISAEIPDPEEDPIAYNLVSQFMMHGPCGDARPSNTCMKDGLCTKHFPKQFNSETYVDENGYPVYKRSDNRRVVVFEKEEVDLDNRYVVPYNRYLIVKYQAHINVEWCNRARSIKYLFKYINKGPDRATMVVEHQNVDANSEDKETIDEIKHYLDCRYISGAEASWRIFEFPVHFRDPAIQRLSFHLEGEQFVTFSESENLPGVINRIDPEGTMFIQWMKTNENCPEARSLTYSEFPEYYVWDAGSKIWKPRNQGNTIGRLAYAHPSSGERFYLRMLLNVVRGARSYKELRTVNGVEYPTFKAACYHRGLLEDDNEWHDALNEAARSQTGQQLRELFVTMLLYCEITDPLQLWEEHWQDLSDDIEYHQRRLCRANNLILLDHQKKTLALYEIELILNRNGRSLKEFPPLPLPDASLLAECNNRLLQEQLSYDRNALKEDHDRRVQKLNAEQKEVYTKVTDAVENEKGGFFFVYGHGGTGKTFLWQTIISRLRSNGHVVLAVASSGIAALIMPGGRTAHSTFKIPLDINETTSCDIRQGTMLAELLCKASLVIWDEACMNHRNVFEAVDRTLRDIIRKKDTTAEYKPFGGIPFVLGGDFRQILPVVPKKGREDIVRASINRSELWDHCQVFLLSQNMRIEQNMPQTITAERVQSFRQWILDLGNGELPTYSLDNETDPSWIKIPEEFLIPSGDNPLQLIMDATYPNFIERYKDAQYLRERAILAPKNEDVDKTNSHILSIMPEEARVYKSSDTICRASANVEEQELLYPTEFLNSLKFSGLPNHELELKVGAVVMLLRNINPSKGLCNGTRLVITQLAKWVIEGRILTGSKCGEKVFIPRIIMCPTEANLPFVLKRRQFPVSICFAMTINKSQGQTLKNVGLYLPKPVFSHGQLYVAVSRVTTPQGLKILIEDDKPEHKGYTKNVVYKDIFNGLPTGC